ncbi:hypothetical protein ACJX0J_036673, partial [Zea mays]
GHIIKIHNSKLNDGAIDEIHYLHALDELGYMKVLFRFHNYARIFKIPLGSYSMKFSITGIFQNWHFKMMPERWIANGVFQQESPYKQLEIGIIIAKQEVLSALK